ncbi:MAG: monovalent cation/H+ antiporter subunit D family protein [Deltaproteobacteria bacterium]|nr:monovalent cation/H+ antiporter subunit D family protein [Deltaproteobacteria bacterium]MBW1833314.1 monovalent cation/H+ antiporter subunit D family protein [Deltaproteobacteria bacterium]MBW2164643.1 monovalent cation/H+ antiporter subunit D family protein [Deltaproteobacteria bacterium]MBW2738605.1 monovalent cation/H+ antiporter subunit D family protein [Deltaproteobacteria bacterium]
MAEQFAALIIVVPLISSLLVPVIGWGQKKLCYPWVVAVLVVPLICSLGILNTVLTTGKFSYRLGGWAPPWGIEYAIDHLNAFVLVIVSFISLMVAIHSKKSVEKELSEKTVPFYTLFLLLVTGLLGIVITGDAFNLFVFLEIASLSCYALIAIGEEGAPIAAFNYIIIGTIGACFYLLGVGYLYIATGSLNMADLANILPDLYHSKVILVAFAFFTVGIAIKGGLFPLHTWLPDAYCTAPSAVSSLIAPLMTKVAAYVMIRLMFTVFQPHFSVEIVPVFAILGWLSVFAIFWGGIKALAQTDIKRMLVYVLVAEVGYIVIGVSVANRVGLTGAILHIMNDAVMMTCLFLVVGAILYKTGTREIHQFRHLNKKMPFTMAAFTITALSMCGIPPACGFFSKWYLIQGTIEAGQWVWAAALLCSSLINAVLFFRVIECAYLKPMEPAYAHNAGETHGEILRDEAPFTMLVPIVIMAAGVIFLGIFSGKIISSVIQFAVPASF